jgi:phospholipase/carboxylesterase
MTDSTVAGPKPLSLVHLVRPPTAPEAGAIEGENVRPPLVLLLHGVGSNEYDLFDLADHLDGRFFAISARAPVTLGQSAFGWYPVAFTPQGPVGDPARAEQSREAILRFIGEAVAVYSLDARRVFLMGFSQGAIMSLYVALTEPATVAGIVPMSGRLLPEAWQARAPDEALRGLPVFAVHGTRDTVLPIHEGRAIRDALQTLPIDLVYREYNMAHEVTAQSLADIAAWLTAQLDGKNASGTV